MTHAVSPLAPKSAPALPSIAGVRIATAQSNTRYKNRPDLLLMAFVEGTTVAGVTTRSLSASAPVEACRAHLKGGRARGLIVNAGNSNAFTGKAGVRSVAFLGQKVAKALDCKPDEVFHASTGIIGQPLPHEALGAFVPQMARELAADKWHTAAEAIRTTDTFAKGASATAKIGKTKVAIAGIAKGSGMIQPDMATMLAFVATDAKLPAGVLQKLLSEGTDLSFNAITVDSDTSTSDTLLLFATGKADHPAIKTAADPKLKDFRRALNAVLLDLAHQVVKDGEGAEKFISIKVTGAASDKAARRIGLSIANSPLVKTAIAGADANWGRIVMAVGKAGEKAERDKLKIVIGGVLVAAKGAVVPGYDETPVAQHMKGRAIQIAVDVGVGKGKSEVWTCDLTHRYIDINADYRS